MNDQELPESVHTWRCKICKDTISGQMCQLKHCENCNAVDCWDRVDCYLGGGC